MLSALIFDMDDLLVASAALWRAAEEKLLAAIGARWTEDMAIQYKGMNALDVAATIHRLLRPSLSLEACQRIMRDELIAGFSKPVHAMPGAVELVQRVHGRWPMAVASGSPRVAIYGALSQLGILERFDEVITSESVPRGKPHPDVFLAAAEALKASPPQCLVFEDSLIGVRAAQAAGMKCFAVPSGNHAAIAELATRVFSSLADIIEDDIAL